MSEPWRDALDKGVSGFMWTMFQQGHQRANLDELEELCLRLIRMASQKSAGQRGNPKELDWNNLNMLYNMIAIEAACLVLDPRFAQLKEDWKDRD